jgi:uncharacterized membrane protein YfcA
MTPAMISVVFIEQNLWLIPVFFAVAAVYSAAGFGGGSSYLAFLTLAGAPQTHLKFIAYASNIVVTAISSRKFAQTKLLIWADVRPFLLGSVPFALLGAAFKLSERAYFLLLASALLISGVLLLTRRSGEGVPASKLANLLNKPSIRFVLSAAIGLISGLVGIGGGVFLAPILHLANWRKPEQIAALSAFFILVNASAGMLASALRGTITWSPEALLYLVLPVIAGGYMGSSFAIHERGRRFIRRLTGIIIIAVGVRIFLM